MAIRVLRRAELVAKILLFGFGWVAVCVPTIGSSQTARADAKPMAFEVVSIRQHKGEDAPNHGTTANGYHITSMSLAVPILTAYVPQTGGAALYMNNQTQGFPDWLLRERYDVEAKVSEADLAEWKKPSVQQEMLRAMLQTMLADRLKLAVHRDIKEVSVYSLVVGKSGPKFKETNPAETHPGGITLPNGGGTVVPDDGGHTIHFYGASMTSLAPLLSNWAGRPVQDKTGLTGKYDLQIPNPAMPVASPDGVAAPDPGTSVITSMEDLGLKLVPTKGQVETLVIDHVERPSEN